MKRRPKEGLRIHSRLVLPPGELTVTSARAGGPGGQRVNKVETKVLLRFSVAASRVLGERRRALLLKRLQHRLTRDGELVITASRYRERSKNEEDARQRLAQLLRDALRTPKPRKATRPSRGSVERRLAAKRQRAELKRRRGSGGDE